MKFLTLEQGQLGALIEDEGQQQVVDLTAAAKLFELEPLPMTLAEIVGWTDEQVAALWGLAQVALDKGVSCRAYSEVKVIAPIPQPRRNILCLGKNYLDHAKEVAEKMQASSDAPEHPIIFTKATTSVIGPGDDIPAHAELTRKLDYEAELALIIGKEGRDIPEEQALDHVFGYTAINDVSARDLQKDHVQWFRAKSLDGFAPMGPVVVHRSVMPEPKDIQVSCHINGEQRQCANLDQLIFDLPTIIATLSKGMTLLPGDIIATGTPAGVGMGFRPSKYLKSGDEVVVSVSGVGSLTNRVV
ncbi:fumarylacetoacetate hydrolase family protein [Maricurvus nonylphenolicus]|uniref:fumarylacetoacetate hydrolase family protein n=1 Tax=Maricurvus nonylphenolicus TaxID=1008307 RepID=UPI0036F2CFDE